MKIVALCSGGIDSIVMVAALKNSGHDVAALHIDYGQVTAISEIKAVRRCMEDLGVEQQVFLNLKSLSQWGEGALSGDNSLQEFFPHRNLLIIANAAVVASKLQAQSVAIGIINSVQGQFADCRPPFIKSLQLLLAEDEPQLSLCTPLSNKEKKEVIDLGISLDVPLTFTFSCNTQSGYHCWKCGSCLERLKYFQMTGIDP